MKYVKILGLLAVAAAALMAFAGTASATSITSPTGTLLPPGSTIHAESEEGAVPGTKHVLLHNNIANIQCESTASFTYDHTSGAGTPTGKIDSLSFFGCTGDWTVTVNHNVAPAPTTGRLEVHKDTTPGAGPYDGKLTSYGTRVTAVNHALGGVQCIYETNAATGTYIGTIDAGNPATLTISASIPRVGGSFLCGGANANWTGNYKTTNAYYIDS